MSGRKPTCRLFTFPQGCRYGDKCKFSHDNGAAGSRTGTPGVSPPPMQSEPARLPSASRFRGQADSAPRGVCDYFWKTGKCTRGFDCTFQHSQIPSAVKSTSEVDEDDANVALDFFTVDGFADVSGLARHQDHDLKPADAHNSVKKYLRDDYKFASPLNMLSFVTILASINRRNKTWNSDSAQDFLDMIVRGNALERICDILKFHNVSSQAGIGFTTLSFQLGYFPILEYMASDLVLKTTLHHNINAIYTVMHNNYEHIHRNLVVCLRQMIDANSWKDRTPGLPTSRQGILTGVSVFKTVTTLILQFLSRFKQAVRDHREILELVNNIVNWFDIWSSNVTCVPPRFEDPITSTLGGRQLMIEQLREDIKQLRSVVDREYNAMDRARRPTTKPTLSHAERRQALISRITQSYDPPGSLRVDGRRHDNDFEDISNIRIAPTNDELTCPISPYLPFNIPDAPHHLPANSMERHIDIQFRLLREDLTFSIRESLTVIRNDLDDIWRVTPSQKRTRTQLEELVDKKGGLYRTSGKNSILFHAYTNVAFLPVAAERDGFTIGLSLDSPPGAARDSQPRKREDYWKSAGSKRLTSGSLIALILVDRGQSTVHLGSLVSSGKELAESSKASDEKIQVRAEFFDAEIELRALKSERISIDRSTFALLIDNNIMFESVRPFLKTLQRVEPIMIPFARYIGQSDGLKDVVILPPKYATAPMFAFNLECLAKPREYIHPLRATDPNSVTRARLQLKQSSNLDPSQCDSVVDALTREVSLIQGPPGTGKSFTGKELLRVFFANKIKPVVLIAFTNHALDHMLTSILDANITNKLVRLGSRPSDDRIAEYSIIKLERTADRSVNREYATKKKLQLEMKQVMESIQIPTITGKAMEAFLDDHYSDHRESLTTPPFWIQELARQAWEKLDAEGPEEWQTVKGKGKKNTTDHEITRTLYGFWKYGFDIEFIKPPQIPRSLVTETANGRKKKKGQSAALTPNLEAIKNMMAEHQKRISDFFVPLGFINQVPEIPTGDRSENELLSSGGRVWNMSMVERSKLATYWEDDMRKKAYYSLVDKYQGLRTEYETACTRFNDVKDESRRRLLSQTDLIGCTTTGAAKLISLLTNISPRVLMVEEAGQVLEAHILAALVPSVQHLICIGDPQQLRPSLATFSLSMDSDRGREYFRFDQSLMERLSENGLPMSLINVQRRMRPSISHNIRTILYPRLEDHATVHKYPRVQGLEKDVYFFTHTNKEDGGEESSSKSNAFEVQMIVDLVMYFLKQEAYSAPGAIAVLCAYLGQVQKVRAALRNLKLAVAVDEKDEEQLVRQGLEEENAFEEVDVAKHVRLGSVDNFQGLEADIVIVSLVRNSGTFDTEASIGFLKSVNRINVALSRAKHGLYIMGNAANLRKNETWTAIINEMEERDQIGFGFPIICPRHSEQRRLINKPGQLSTQAPGGGCLVPCTFRLACGHNCPSVCHADRDNHKSTKCNKPCTKLACTRLHPCPRRCWEDCSKCVHPIYNVQLPCGHEAKSVLCHQLEDLRSVKCTEEVVKNLSYCEHSATMACHQDPFTFKCKAVCDCQMSCCSNKCKSLCSDCQKLNLDASSQRKGIIKRSQHKDHPCERVLYCQHYCGLPCSKDHECSTKCSKACRQRCDHHTCPKPCSASCAPCMEPCRWQCAHARCPVLCGSICSRLPCDERCSHDLKCGHPCPSVCGEPCAKQKCIVCLPVNKKTDIVDLIMQRPLSEIDLTSTDTSEQLITLDCGHIFTVETLDGHCQMGEYYYVDSMGKCTAPKAPPINYQTPPTCPTCRGPITALRYGRITKRANLDILEQNIASNMSQSLENLTPALIAISADIASSEESAKKMKYEPPSKPVQEFDDLVRLRSEKFGNQDEPLPAYVLDQKAMKTIHGFAGKEGRVWQGIVENLFLTYRNVVCIVNTRSAHVVAYQAALSTLYHLELAEIAQDSTRATDHPEPIAISAVNQKIGQPPYKADRRYHVEAFLLSIELRFMLAQVARARVDSLPGISNDPEVLHHRQLWSSFVEFIFESCIVDCKKTIAIADSSSAYRQVARAAIMQIRSHFEQFRFDLLNRRDELFRKGELSGDRKALKNEIRVQKSLANEFLEKVSKTYIRSRPIKDAKDLMEERTWFLENCGNKALRVLKEYDDLEKYITVDGMYQPMTLQEREDIVKAFGFSHRGHFYNCENGHTFVITECGGAMESARCPECRAPIGGSHHSLASSNSRAMEFEEIAGRQGAETSPWAWARDA